MGTIKEVEDLTAKSYVGRVVEGVCPKCGLLAGITALTHEEPTYCPGKGDSDSHMTCWEVVECQNCDGTLLHGDDSWICSGCNQKYVPEDFCETQ